MMSKFMKMSAYNKNHIRISEAANILGVSAKTLRRWNKSGKLIPKRSDGGQRFYTFSQLRAITQEPIVKNNNSIKQTKKISFKRVLSVISFVYVWSALLSTISLPAYKYLPDSPSTAADSRPSAVEVASHVTQPAVLAASDASYLFNVKLPSIFSDTVTFESDISAPNIVNSVNNEVGDVTIALTAGNGITVDGLQITNSGILSLSAGSGISVDGNKITNTSTPDYTQSGWTDNGTSVVLTTTTDTVTVGTFTAGAITATSLTTGGLSLSNDLVVSSGYSLLPETDLGSDLGANDTRFNNLYVANINSNSGLSTAGQAIFTYEPTDTTLTEGSVLINPTAPVANGQLLSFAVGGYQKALIDEDGDMVLGYYNSGTAAPAFSNDYPLAIYDHTTNNVAYIDTSGNLALAAGADIKPLSDSTTALNVANSSGTPFVTFDTTNSRVGIGTTGPTASLYVNGTSNFQGNITTASISISSGNVTWAPRVLTIASAGGDPTIIKPDSGYLALGANSAEVIRIITSGNVGIGTTAPTSKLHLTGAVTGKALAIFDETGDQDIFTASSSGTPKIVINHSGYLGVGTTAPTSIIHGVSSLTAATGNETSYSLNYTTNKATSGNDIGLAINWTDTASPGTSSLLAITRNGSDFFKIGTDGTTPGSGPIELRPVNFGGGGALLLYGQGGASTNAAYIDFRTSSTRFVAGPNGQHAALHSFTPTSTVADVLPYADDNNTGLGWASADILSLVAGGTNALNATTTGIGIGTTSPTSKLHVTGAVTGKALAIFDETGDQALLTASASAATKFTINHYGLVNATAGGLATYVKAGTISDTDFTDTAVDGLLGVDSTDGRLYVRNNSGTWNYIAFTAGFQIPDFEAGGLEVGDLLLPYVETKMADGALHGLYKKFDIADFLTVNQLSILNDQVAFNEEITTQVLGLEDTTSNLQVLIANIQKAFSDFANKFVTKQSIQEELCIGTEESNTCLNKDQVDEIVKTLPSPAATPEPVPTDQPQAITSPSSTPSATPIIQAFPQPTDTPVATQNTATESASLN